MNLKNVRDRREIIKTGLTEIWIGDAEWIKLTEDVIQCQAYGKAVVKLPVP